MELLYLKHPLSKLAADNFNKKYASYQKLAKESDVSYIIPVVFHVFGTVFNSGTTVTDSIIINALKKPMKIFRD